MPSVNFRSYMDTVNQFNIPNNNNFVDIVHSIWAQRGDFSREFSVSLTGLLFVAKALESSNSINVRDIQENTDRSSEWLGLESADVNTTEFAFHPWTSLSGYDTHERAACLYQRRMRRNGSVSIKDTQEAYVNLAVHILQRFKNDGRFVASREDYRDARKMIQG